jgi:D-glycero-alpha-D-manno-heptose-7-phosphate kinase
LLISKTNLRVSLLGGGSDYSSWFLTHGGCVIVTGINKYVWVTFNNGIVTKSFDLPEKSGLATSSAYTVGLLKILAELKSTDSDPKTIAQFATLIEQEKSDNRIGYQDQYICSMGGFRLLRFSEAGIRDYEFIDIDWLEPYLMLFITHQYRKRSGDIVSSQLDEMNQHTDLYLKLMDLTEQGKIALEKKNWQDFGLLLDESWKVKKQLSNKITTLQIDDIYSKSLKAGAIGGKILGVGGGGAMVLLASLDKQEDIKNSIPDCEYIPFKFSKEGSRIIYREDK